jgi:hypothetical protein
MAVNCHSLTYRSVLFACLAVSILDSGFWISDSGPAAKSIHWQDWTRALPALSAWGFHIREVDRPALANLFPQ